MENHNLVLAVVAVGVPSYCFFIQRRKNGKTNNASPTKPSLGWEKSSIVRPRNACTKANAAQRDKAHQVDDDIVIDDEFPTYSI